LQTFRFIDLFAGIGGMRIPFDSIGGRCVFTSEIDPYAREVYASNFQTGHPINTDLTNIDETPQDVPNHDLILAGFPCQPFSNAGKKRGFEDTRGTLFFSIANIAKTKRPRVLLLENVRGLKSHDGGNTLAVIEVTLKSLGYFVHTKVLNARDFGLPQNRNRLFIVAIREDIKGAEAYTFPSPTSNRDDLNVSMILEKNIDVATLTISDRLWAGHRARKAKNLAGGKGFGYQLVDGNSNYTATLSARYYKDGSEILVSQEGLNPRLLSVREAGNLQGFPSNFVFHESKKQAYKQLGNAVPVAVIHELARSLGRYL
jgi:DNA (cytosine-5)-methyltransferase 1